MDGAAPAAESGHETVARLLLEQEADIDGRLHMKGRRCTERLRMDMRWWRKCC
jgi:hypothetical protein